MTLHLILNEKPCTFQLLLLLLLTEYWRAQPEALKHCQGDQW